MRARLRSAALACGLLGCLQGNADTSRPTHDGDLQAQDERKSEGDPRVDPSRCTGDALELTSLVGAGLCTVSVAEALALPGADRLELIAPRKLVVAPGERLEFELVLRNRGPEPVHVDLRLRQFLPLGPETTVRLGDGSGPDPSCTLSPMSTEPPPERITLPPDAELAIPCEWYANARLVDPRSYVGSECPDFPALAPGRYRSSFRVNGAAGSQREIAVEIDVRAPRR